MAMPRLITLFIIIPIITRSKYITLNIKLLSIRDLADLNRYKAII